MVMSAAWFAHQLEDQLAVERLGEPRVRHGRPDAARAQRLGRLQALRQPRAEGQDRDALPFQHDAPAPDLQRHAALGQLHARPLRRAESGTTIGRSSIAAAVATMCTSSASSAAAITTKSGRQAR